MCGADCVAIALPRRGVYVFVVYIYIARWRGNGKGKGEGTSNVTRGTRAADAPHPSTHRRPTSNGDVSRGAPLRAEATGWSAARTRTAEVQVICAM